MKLKQIIKYNILFLYYVAFIVLMIIFFAKWQIGVHGANQMGSTEAYRMMALGIKGMRLTVFIYAVIQGLRWELQWIMQKTLKTNLKNKQD